MTDRNNSAKNSTNTVTSDFAATSLSPGSNVIRARHRRNDNAHHSGESSINARPGTSNERLWGGASRSRNASRPSENSPSRFDAKGMQGGHDLTQFLGDSWTQSWTSIQGFASSWIPNGNKSSSGSESQHGIARPFKKNSRHGTWGPPPPSQSRTTSNLAAGSPAHSQAARKAAKTASALESCEGENGALDMFGNHKRRKSDESPPHDVQPAEQLVYVHKVQPEDTYAGIVLRYKCREDTFRKSNRLWSRDSVQTRKWLTLPVDACEIKGRPLDSQLWHEGSEMDLLGSTSLLNEDAPSSNEISSSGPFAAERHDSASNVSIQCEQDADDDKPWTHVRWVQIDSFPKPVQIVRVSRQSLGYFPPRRKTSARTASPAVSPIQGSDLSSLPVGMNERPSSSRFNLSIDQQSDSGPRSSSHGRRDSETIDARPSWMRRPGGVGSMSLSVKEPGPDKDYFNTWARKHLPGLDLETMPSMSVMGSDSAHFGFGQASATIVENPYEGRDFDNTSRLGSGLDRAAAAVEHWLRGALSKQPSASFSGNRPGTSGLSSEQDVSDLIELTDATDEENKQTNLLTSSSHNSVNA